MSNLVDLQASARLTIVQDIVALVVQAIGGATASRAVKTDGDPEKVRILNKSIYRSFLTMAYVQGGHIMLAGIVFQMGKLTTVGSYIRIAQTTSSAAITIYVTLASEFILRFLSNNPISKPETKEEYQVQPLDKQTKLMLLGLAFTSITIFIR